MADTPIRRARPEDAAAIAALTREAYAKWVDLIGREPLPMQVDYAEALSRHRFDLLLIGDALAALIETVADGEFLLIENLAVRPPWQKRGYGGRLAAMGRVACQDQAGLRGLRLYTNQRFAENIRFYQRFGFVDRARGAARRRRDRLYEEDAGPGVATRYEAYVVSRQVNLAEKLASFSELWSPRTVAKFNGCDVMVVKVQDEFVWHKHDDTDDFFLVLKGRLEIELRDRTIALGPGELFVVPKGVEHRPRARRDASAADRTRRHAEYRRCGDGGAAHRNLSTRVAPGAAASTPPIKLGSPRDGGLEAAAPKSPQRGSPRRAPISGPRARRVESPRARAARPSPAGSRRAKPSTWAATFRGPSARRPPARAPPCSPRANGTKRRSRFQPPRTSAVLLRQGRRRRLRRGLGDFHCGLGIARPHDRRDQRRRRWLVSVSGKRGTGRSRSNRRPAVSAAKPAPDRRR